MTNDDLEKIKSAMEEGVAPESIQSTINDILNNSNNKNTNPKQIRKVMSAIAFMKSSILNKENKEFASNLVRNNSEKIKAALKDGLTPNEIAKSLVSSLDKANTLLAKKNLKFLVKLITKMKTKELRLQNQVSKQKVLYK